MRSVLMTLGILLHTSLIFSPSSNWAITDLYRDSFFEVLYAFIHTFRIPCFFLISGFFSLYIIKKYGLSKFLKTRLRRIAIPLISTALLINPFDQYIRFIFKHDFNPNLLSFYKYNMPSILFKGEWDLHLWFLNYLILYFIIGVLIIKLYRKFKSSFNENYIKRFSIELIPISIIILVFPLWYLFTLTLVKIFPTFFYSEILGIFDLDKLLYYMPFFFFGMVLFAKPKLLKRFSEFNLWQIILILVGSLIYFTSPILTNGMLNRIISSYSHYLNVWVLSSLCFSFFHIFFNKHSKIFQYLSDASYTIYLFHQIIVVLLGFYFVDQSLNIYLKFSIIVLSTFIITVIIHNNIILKLPLLRFLFNGKYQ